MTGIAGFAFTAPDSTTSFWIVPSVTGICGSTISPVGTSPLCSTGSAKKASLTRAAAMTTKTTMRRMGNTHLRAILTVKPLGAGMTAPGTVSPMESK